mgnify:CR=1 FL=1
MSKGASSSLSARIIDDNQPNSRAHSAETGITRISAGSMLTIGKILIPQMRMPVATADIGRSCSIPIPNRRAISASMNALELATKDFAARRMDKSIRRAFAGRRIDEISEIEAATGDDVTTPGAPA